MNYILTDRLQAITKNYKFKYAPLSIRKRHITEIERTTDKLKNFHDQHGDGNNSHLYSFRQWDELANIIIDIHFALKEAEKLLG